MKNLHHAIDKLSGYESKGILLNLMHRVQIIRESKELRKEDMNILYAIQDQILGVSKEKKFERRYDTVHIVCGESAAGSLRYGLGSENKIIGFPDFFAVGPILKLHQEVGRKRRYEWLRDHLNYPNDFIEEEYEARFLKDLEEIAAIREHVPIVIWTAENAGEQTGTRYLLYLLKEKMNEISLINTTKAFQELFNTSEYQYFYPHTGEVAPEKLNLIYQKKQSEPLTAKERIQFENEWMRLTETKEVVRIWDNQKIHSVDEDYFDELIISTAREIHAGQRDFIKSGRLIGEMLGHTEGKVGDAFLEYRLRSLIYSGVFEIKGIPKGMRYYSVKLR